MTSAAVKASESMDCLPTAAAPSETLQECILLIEDNEDSMLLVTYALQEFGRDSYRLVWANSLGEGLTQLEKDRVDMILLDLGLPESSGLASYTAVHGAAPEVPVVVLTGEMGQETEIAILASGAQDYLVKDQTSGSILLQAIRSAIYARRRQEKVWGANYQQFSWLFK